MKYSCLQLDLDPECHRRILCPERLRSQVRRGSIPDRSRRSDYAAPESVRKLGHFLWFFLQRRTWFYYPGICRKRRSENALPGDATTNHSRGDFSLLEKPDHVATGFGQNPSTDECRPAHEKYYSGVSTSPVIILGASLSDRLQYSPGYQTCQYPLDTGIVKFAL